MSTELAQSDASNTHPADTKVLSDKRIQIDSFGHDITPRMESGERKPGLAGKCINLLLLDKGDLVIRLLRVLGKSAETRGIPIAFKSHARNCVHFWAAGHWTGWRISNQDVRNR